MFFVLCFASSRGADAGSAPPPALIPSPLGVSPEATTAREGAGRMLEYQGRPVAHRGRAGESCCIFFLALFRGDLEHLQVRNELPT